VLAGILVLAGLLPAVEEINAGSLLFVALALGVGLLLTTNCEPISLDEQAAALFDLYSTGPLRFLKDAINLFNLPALTAGFTVGSFPWCSAASLHFCSRSQIH
jgi:hypothetical protein